MHHLYLIGLPGSGKTTLGSQLAARYGRGFLDLDAEIVARAGRSVPAIFEAEGEDGFRKREAAALRAVAARPEALVVATGGGTPCFHDNLAVLRNSGFLLWLDVPLPELVRRLAASSNRRPLLAAALQPAQTPGAALFAHLQRTLAARERFYGQAHLRLAGVATAAATAAALTQAGFVPGPTQTPDRA
ncbi:shikimate kinase [Hymenobacter baengnokdamensis]|uniref:shikimate kinase n=1 Tax=Hymenobacter baengnokdamensis TaxID=2615203 RepID=UPI001244767E|nr:shikimate kinase [Hymenobacter baengnokdamensis]